MRKVLLALLVAASPTVNAGAVAPVPEPETYALMAMGLGAVLWQVKRRKHREGCHSLA